MPKRALTPVKIVSAGDMSGNITSPVTTISWQDNIVYQANITGSPVGVLNVETSSDYNTLTANAGNWVTLGTSYQATVNGAETIVYDLQQLGPCYVRLKYTRTSGTGSMDVYISGKEI